MGRLVQRAITTMWASSPRLMVSGSLPIHGCQNHCCCKADGNQRLREQEVPAPSLRVCCPCCHQGVQSAPQPLAATAALQDISASEGMQPHVLPVCPCSLRMRLWGKYCQHMGPGSAITCQERDLKCLIPVPCGPRKFGGEQILEMTCMEQRSFELEQFWGRCARDVIRSV